MLSKIKKPEDLECYDEYLRLIRSDLKKFKRAAAKDPELKESFYIISEYTFKHNKADDGQEVTKPVVVIGDLKSAIERDELKNKSTPSSRLKGSCGLKDDNWQLYPDGGNMKLKTIKKELKPFWKEVKVKFTDIQIMKQEANDDADGLKLEQRDGFKLVGQSGYAKIKELLAQLKSIPKNNIEERIRIMDELTQKAKAWEIKHAKDKSKRGKKILSELADLRQKLEPALDKLRQKEQAATQEAQMDYLTGNIKLLLRTFKAYKQPNDSQLIELAQGGPDAFASLNDKLEDLGDILELVEGWRATNKGKNGLDKERQAVDKIEAQVKQYRYEIQQALAIEVGEDEFISLDEDKGKDLSHLFAKKKEVKEQFRTDVILWDQTLYKGFDKEIEQEMRDELKKAGKTKEEIEQSLANRRRVLEEQQQLMKRNFLAMAALGVEMGNQKKPSSFKAYDKPVPLASLSSHGGRFAFEAQDGAVAERFQRLLMMGDQNQAVRKDGPTMKLGGLLKGTDDPRNLLSADTSNAYAGFYNRVSTHPQHYDAKKGAWVEGKSILGSYHDNSIGLDLPFGGVGNKGPKGKILQEGLFQQEDGNLGQHGHGLFIFNKDEQGGGRMMVAFEGASPSRANQTGSAHDIISATSSVLKKTSAGKKFLKSINRYEERSVSGQDKAAKTGVLPEDEEKGKVLKEGALRAQVDEQKLEQLQKFYEALELIKKSSDKTLIAKERKIMQQLMASTDQEKRKTLTDELVDLGMEAQKKVSQQEWQDAFANLQQAHEKYLKLDKADTGRVVFAFNNYQWIEQLLADAAAPKEGEALSQLQDWKKRYDQDQDDLEALDVQKQAKALTATITLFEQSNRVIPSSSADLDDYQFAKLHFEQGLALQEWLQEWLPRANKEDETTKQIQKFADGLDKIISQRERDMQSILEQVELSEGDAAIRDAFIELLENVERLERSQKDTLEEQIAALQSLRASIGNWEPAEANLTLLRNGLLAQVEERLRRGLQARQDRQQKAAQDTVAELKKAGDSAEDLFKAFMAQYKGSLVLDAHSDGSNVLAGSKNASPVAVANAFAALLLEAGLEAKVNKVPKVLSQESDGNWVSSNPGNVFDVDANKVLKQFYFYNYATVQSGGTTYCPSSGQKQSVAAQTGLQPGGKVGKQIFETYANTPWLSSAEGQAFVLYSDSFPGDATDLPNPDILYSPIFYNTDLYAAIRARFVEFLEKRYTLPDYLLMNELMAGHPTSINDAKRLFETYIADDVDPQINLPASLVKGFKTAYQQQKFEDLIDASAWKAIRSNLPASLIDNWLDFEIEYQNS